MKLNKIILGLLTAVALIGTVAGAVAVKTGVFTNNASGTAVKQNGQTIIDYSNVSDGYVMVSWIAKDSAKLKVIITDPNDVKYTYNLNNTGKYETFPLSSGNGNYKVGVYKNTQGTKYATILSLQVNVSLKDQFEPFIRPNQFVNYNDTNEAIKLAQSLCEKSTTNLQKVNSIYTYVIENISYDYDKAKTVQSGYLPDIDNVLKEKKGICFDYAALMCAMLRSQGVPTKLVIGYAGTAYHAWINVWSETDGWVNSLIQFNGEKWELMDPTFASTGKQSESIMKYIGDGQNYTVKFTY